MEQQNMLSSHLRDGRIPRMVNAILIDEAHRTKHARLPHTHENELELFYVYDGAGDYMVDNRTYHIRRGDIVICNAGVLHGEDGNGKRTTRSYSIALADVAFRGLPDNWLCERLEEPVVPTGLLADQVGQMIRLLYFLSADLKHLQETCNSLANAVLLLTHDLLLSRERHPEDTARLPADVLAHRVQRYLDQHFREPITLQSISKALNISEYYLAHVFKDEVGVPPMRYVMKRRIGEAQSLLTNTTLPIAEISERLSFNSPCHFNTMFNKYVGTPPGKYRQSFRMMRDG